MSDFQPFPRLPAEVRRQIYMEACEPHFITVNLKKYGREWHNKFGRTIPNPPILSSCVEIQTELLKHYKPLNNYRKSTAVPVSPVLYFNKEKDFLYIHDPIYFDKLLSLPEISEDILEELSQFRNIALNLEYGCSWQRPKLQHRSRENDYRRRRVLSLFANLETILILTRHDYEPKYEGLRELDRETNKDMLHRYQELIWQRAVDADYDLNWEATTEAEADLKTVMSRQKRALGGHSPMVQVMARDNP